MDIILFDLDGTLTDPGLGITNSVMYALRKYGMEVPPRQELYSFIGPPLKQSFMRWCGFDEAEGEQAVKYYREYYRDKGLLENEVYDGIEDMLKALREKGKRLAVATSKPEEFARRILEHFGLAQYFEVIAGDTLDFKRNTKADVIASALERLGVTDRSGVIMVGDREHDVIGAKAQDLPCIGVLFGYGSQEELEAAGAKHIAQTPADVLKYV
ncbi:MAG: HAD family hydrolase [bacterium]|nr:HAD family hydrolase [bacterium]